MGLSLRRIGLSIWTAYLVVGFLGAIEGLYGRDQYLGDWISYLNVSRAVSSFDLKAIFDPMWSPGYPILVACFRALFPDTAMGEWRSICLLNWLLFLAFFTIWRYLIREGARLYGNDAEAQANSPVFLWLSTLIFLGYGLAFDAVSRVAPDMLVSLMFVLATACMMRLVRRPTSANAVILGVVLGIGPWTKGIFEAYAGIFLFTLFLICLAGRLRWPRFCVVVGCSLAFILPLGVMTSWAFGHVTLGVTGSINYAFHVNHLPHWTNWQGGPSELGRPVHPTHQLIPDLPVYGFGEPFHTTYPAYNNMAYFYDGYRRFFSLGNELAALHRTAHALLYIVKDHPIVYAFALAMLVVISKLEWRQAYGTALRKNWFVFLPCLLGLFTYLLVHVEDRYLTPSLLIAAFLPILPLQEPGLASRRRLAVFLLVVFGVGAMVELRIADGHTFLAALHRHDFRQDEHWRIASAVSAAGLGAGSPVAVILDDRNGIRCSWAYMARVRIVAEFGSQALSLPYVDHYPFDPPDGHSTPINYADVFGGLSPDVQANVLAAFRKEGAQGVLSYDQPEVHPTAGWQPIEGTGAWLYVFPR